MASPSHRLENVFVDMLERHVKILADVGMTCRHFHQFPRQVAGVTIEKTDPTQTFNLGEFGKQLWEAVAGAQVAPVMGRVLGNQVQFADPAGRMLCGFGNQGGDRPASE